MLDLKLIRQDPDRVRQGASAKGMGVDVGAILRLDEERRSLIAESERLKNRRNVVSEEVGRLRKAGGDAAATIAEMRVVNERIKDLEELLRRVEDDLSARLWLVPNLAHASVPHGGGADDNVVIRQVGTPRPAAQTPLPHWDLGTSLGILDLDRCSRLSGARFTMSRGAGALLERALINLMLDLHTRTHGYEEIFPPFLVTSDCMRGTGQLPKFAEDMFKVEGRDLFLIPTAEVPITNIHRGEILDAAQLPLNYTAYSACFRAEAGAAGRDTRGLIRVHQFNKVELVKYAHPETSYDELERLVVDAQAVLELLELPYRVVLLCDGDLSFAAAKTYDLEVWLPSYQDYKEISSCSNFEDFQARRANLRFRPAQGERPEFVHTLNGSGLAIGRTVAAILENCQNDDGSVTVPKALRAYMHGLERITS